MKPPAKPTPRNCVECGKEFEAIGKRKICSDECSAARNKRKTIERARRHAEETRLVLPRKPCAACGKNFQPAQTNHLTCSPPCAKEYNRKRARHNFMTAEERAPKACDYCGTEFVPERRTSHYCSRDCSQKAYKRRREGKAEREDALRVVECPICEFRFEREKGSHQKYCSDKCAHEAVVEQQTAWRMMDRYDDAYEPDRFVWDDGSNDNYWLDEEWQRNQGKLNRIMMLLPPIGPMAQWASLPCPQPEAEPDQPAGQVASEGRVYTPRELFSMGVGKKSQIARWQCRVPVGMLIGSGGSITWKSKFTGNRRQTIDVG